MVLLSFFLHDASVVFGTETFGLVTSEIKHIFHTNGFSSTSYRICRYLNIGSFLLDTNFEDQDSDVLLEFVVWCSRKNRLSDKHGLQEEKVHKMTKRSTAQNGFSQYISWWLLGLVAFLTARVLFISISPCWWFVEASSSTAEDSNTHRQTGLSELLLPHSLSLSLLLCDFRFGPYFVMKTWPNKQVVASALCSFHYSCLLHACGCVLLVLCHSCCCAISR